MAEMTGSELLDVAKVFEADAIDVEPEGNLDWLREANDLSEVIRCLADVIDARCQGGRNRSIAPEYLDAFGAIGEAIDAVAAKARALPEIFEAYHAERVNDLVSGTDPSGWDTAVNKV